MDTNFSNIQKLPSTPSSLTARLKMSEQISLLEFATFGQMTAASDEVPAVNDAKGDARVFYFS